MAHLEVEPKPGRPWWTWVLLAIVLIALAILLYNKYGTKEIAVNHGNTKSITASAIIST